MKRTATPNRLGYKSFYRRNLPHIQPLNTALFLTFRLAGSLPEEVLARMAQERRLLERSLKTSGRESKTQLGQLARRHFATLESWLDKAAFGPTWLADSHVANPTGRLFNHAEPCPFCLRTFSATQRSGVSLIHHAFAQTEYFEARQPIA